jgi:hypothetical protein
MARTMIIWRGWGAARVPARSCRHYGRRSMLVEVLACVLQVALPRARAQCPGAGFEYPPGFGPAATCDGGAGCELNDDASGCTPASGPGCAFTADGAAAGGCTACPAGRHDGDSSALTPCEPCGLGSHAGAGQTACAQCAAGTADVDDDPGTASHGR